MSNKGKAIIYFIMAAFGFALAVHLFWVGEAGDRILWIYDIVGLLLILLLFFFLILNNKDFMLLVKNFYKTNFFSHLMQFFYKKYKSVLLFVICAMGVVFFLDKLFVFGVQNVLQTQSVVVDAKIIRTEWYSGNSSAVRWWPLEVDKINKAGFIRVYLELPDGRHTDLSLVRPFPANLKNFPRKVILFQELEACTMKVRYWTQGTWLVRPELEFTNPSFEEIQNLVEDKMDGNNNCNKYPLGSPLNL